MDDDPLQAQRLDVGAVPLCVTVSLVGAPGGPAAPGCAAAAARQAGWLHYSSLLLQR